MVSGKGHGRFRECFIGVAVAYCGSERSADVGLVAIMVVGGLAPAAERAVDYLRAKMPKFNYVADKIEDQVDTDKLTKALNDIDERIRSIEVKIGDGE